MVPDITGGALCPRPHDPPSSPSSPSSSPPLYPPLSAAATPPPSEELTADDDATQDTPPADEGKAYDDDDDDDDEEDEEVAAACCDKLHQKRLSMESGYSASEKHLEDEVVAMETTDQQQPTLLHQSEPPSERLPLPSTQTDGKLANRDSGIDSISSPSHSEELCFAGVDDGGVAYPCSPALIPHLSSSPSSYASEGGGARGGSRRRRDFSEEGDSDLEEEEAELTLVLEPPKTDRQDSSEVRAEHQSHASLTQLHLRHNIFS